MWLVLDIGNTRTKGGLFRSNACIDTFHFATPIDPVGWHAAIHASIDGKEVKRVGFASVVPERTALAHQVLPDLCSSPVLEVHPQLRLPFTLTYTTPATLGTDRLAAAAAAWSRFGATNAPPRPIIVLDAGTALNYEVVTAAGTYPGGVIAAGPVVLLDALSKGTAQLPRVDLSLPPGPIGQSTTEALQSGIMYAFVDGVERMLERLSRALTEDEAPAPVVVATGGWGPWLSEHLTRIDHVEPDLVLLGIYDLMTLNPTPGA